MRLNSQWAFSAQCTAAALCVLQVLVVGFSMNDDNVHLIIDQVRSQPITLIT